MPQTLDPVTQHHVRQAADALAGEFAGVFSQGDDRALHRRLARPLGDARINVFVPVLAHRFARERLRALGQAEGTITKEQPEVLFVCVHNAGRSQMAAGLVKLRSEGRIHVRSAGSQPADEINPAVVEAMEELGVDMERGVPEAAHRRGRPRGGRRDHDGLRRRVPDLSRASATRTGSSTTPPGRTSRPCARIRDEIDGRVQKLVTELLG